MSNQVSVIINCEAGLAWLREKYLDKQTGSKPRQQKSPGNGSHSEHDIDRLRKALKFVHITDRDDWIEVLMALKHDNIPSWVADEWSAGQPEYKGTHDVLHTWNGCHPKEITLGTVFHRAKEAGWIEEKRVVPLKRLERVTPLDSNTSTGAQQQNPQCSFDNSQLSIARQALKTFGEGNIIFAQLCFHVWDGKVWKICDEQQIKQRIISVCEVGDRSTPKPKEITSNRVGSILGLMKSEAFRDDIVFDKPTNTINCLNGELHLQDQRWELRAHKRESYRLSLIPVEYDPNAKCPRFEQFLEEIFAPDPDKAEKKAALLQFLGYSLTSNWELNWQFEKFIITIGRGSNGKSKIENLIDRLLGTENVCAVDPSQFDNKFQLAFMRGKLVNFVAEIKEGGDINDAALKRVTSGAKITVENKHRDPFTFRPYAKCWFGTNHLPHTRDITHAFFRRALILTFNVIFRTADDPDRKPDDPIADRLLDEKLAAELPGILNLCLVSLSEILSNGFTEPPSSVEIKTRWRTDCDQVALFIEECCKTGPGYSSPVGDLYRKYKEWAVAFGISRTFASNKFGERLENLGYPADKGTAGVRMRQNIEVDYKKCP